MAYHYQGRHQDAIGNEVSVKALAFARTAILQSNPRLNNEQPERICSSRLFSPKVRSFVKIGASGEKLKYLDKIDGFPYNQKISEIKTIEKGVSDYVRNEQGKIRDERTLDEWKCRKALPFGQSILA